MDTDQRVVRRSTPYSRALIAVAAVAFGLLIYAVIWSNQQDELPQLLDVQSATTAVLGTTGAILARGQYARAVRPSIGWFGRVTADAAPAGRLAWICYAVNGAQDSCTVSDVGYQVVLTGDPVSDSGRWTSMEHATSAMEGRGLTSGSHFHLNLISPGQPITADRRLYVGWFTEAAMAEVRDVYVRLRVVDRVGDTHERVLELMRGAERQPAHPNIHLS
ncbi:hypothetical protein ABZ869_04825 [Streptomyces sp. NPDC046928]|uniref:hypothetical protein n=1 Tax=Streptomyces sp. NPDC046928 TaxID=3155021 RepID=UPI0033F6467F